jgi:NitT/TauT family transport system substrate-binding protein
MAQAELARLRPIRRIGLVFATTIVLLAGFGLARPAALDAAEPLLVEVGGPRDDPVYLPVYAAAALHTFESEGVVPVLRRAKHPTAAINALRDRQATVAVTTTDQAVRGAWARGTPVRILVAHTLAPAAALLVSRTARDRVARVEDLRGKRVGIPGPGTTGSLLLSAILRAHRIEPWQVDPVSLAGPTLVARLGTGELAAAVVDEPWASHALATDAADALVDFRRPEVTVRELGGPFYEFVSVVRSDDQSAAAPEPALAAFARALIRVQAWLARTPAAAVADRLPAELVGDRDRFLARLTPFQAAYAADGQATDVGLTATLRLLRGGAPWPVSLKLKPADLSQPAFVTEARTRLGAEPPPP